MMLRRLFISLMMVVIAALSTSELSAQTYNRERLRGNVRSINQGGLVPIDSAAILRAKAMEVARRDSLYWHFIDSVAMGDNILYDQLPTEARDSIRTIVAAKVRRDSMTRSRGDSIAPDGRRVRLDRNGNVKEPFFSDSMKMSSHAADALAGNTLSPSENHRLPKNL